MCISIVINNNGRRTKSRCRRLDLLASAAATRTTPAGVMISRQSRGQIDGRKEAAKSRDNRFRFWWVFSAVLILASRLDVGIALFVFAAAVLV